MRYFLLFSTSLLVVGCAGQIGYVKPMTQVAANSNVKIINKSRDAVWNESVPQLGKQFFVINNLDKASGLMNVSYSGDPESYIDCGQISSHVENLRGSRTYKFPAAKAQQNFEVMNSAGLFFVDRRMNLEGRVNLIFEETGPNTTRVTANTKYVVTRTQDVRAAANGASQTLTDTISFNSGGRASFPTRANGQSECVASGRLEKEILSAVN